MKKLIIALLAAAAIAPACEAAAAEPDKAAVLAAINAYQPGVTVSEPSRWTVSM